MKQMMQYFLSRAGNRKTAFWMLFFSVLLSDVTYTAYGKVPEADTWIKDATIQKVTFYHKIVTCNKQTVVLLRFENANKRKMKIGWNEVYSTLQNAAKFEGASGKKQLIILPGETASISCEDTRCGECIIFPKNAILTHKADITQFEFKDIEVNNQ